MTRQKVLYERLILDLLSYGNKAPEIGKVIGISGRSVEKYIQIMMANHKAKNSVHLVSIAFRKKIVK